MARTWIEQLETILVKNQGEKKGKALIEKYAPIFTPSYIDDYSAEMAVSDIASMEKLSPTNPLEADFYYSENVLHLRLFQLGKPKPLSDILPILENLDLRIDSASSHVVILDEQPIWIGDFIVIYSKQTIEIEKVKSLFQETLAKVYFGLAENDGLNKLVIDAHLDWREIMLLRTYAKYLRQIGFRFTQHYIEKALLNHPEITRLLIDYFKLLHDPKKYSKDNKAIAETEAQILHLLDAVTSLDEDKILRRLLDLIKATLRTNYFQTKDGEYKTYLTVKLNSRMIPEIPLPTPLYEIFMYSPRCEGIHLRNTKVARGGIRWSDRPEDFRTEILGLMKAQVVKNSIIVPSGAKGGFIVKSIATSREALQKEVIACYKAFINGLLDITDNIENNNIVCPKEVVCHDEADPYLVVAADKGTASFSDIANSISAEHHFWLGDAFASGGSTGYDHKKMGITARGAWESIKRHFRELDIDVKKTDITVVGIGDMSGDVFGNGMLYSKNIKLIAAFDHRHIFIDPEPQKDIAYAERARLFQLPGSSWADYNPQLISAGGGVFSRSMKAIPISPQMQQALGITDSSLAPAELIRAVLKAPVDLLFNGGIGTYVKSSRESNAEVGDRSNDYTRINGDELRCRVVGEGGNLGFTQLGRIEYAMQGGLINTDFIDNSGGVDCSDHEVNLKIFLDGEVKKGKLTVQERNTILASLVDEVAEAVLHDNYSQALVMSYSAFSATKNITLHINYLRELSELNIFKRRLEFLPDEKELVERKATGHGLTRPEIAVILAYTKIHIKQQVLKSDLPEDPFLSQLLQTAFPKTIANKYSKELQDHPLKRDIIATQLSNHVINEMGITFVYRLQVETGATVDEIVRAHAVASHIFNTEAMQNTIEGMDFKIPLTEQYEMLYNIRNLINLATRWFLHSNHLKEGLQNVIDHYYKHIKNIEPIIPSLMTGATKAYYEHLTDKFINLGLSKETATKIATYRAIYTSLNIIDIATIHNLDMIKTAQVYFSAGEELSLVWFRDTIASDSREGHWNTLARLTLRDELDISQRAATVAIMNKNNANYSSAKLVALWKSNNQRIFARWEKMLEMLHSSNNIEYTMFFIAIRELIGLIVLSQ